MVRCHLSNAFGQRAICFPTDCSSSCLLRFFRLPESFRGQLPRGGSCPFDLRSFDPVEAGSSREAARSLESFGSFAPW